MNDEPTTIDWLLHITRGHTPTEDWERRNSLEFYFKATTDGLLVTAAPRFREEVIRLREGIRHILSEETAYNLEVFERKLMELIE